MRRSVHEHRRQRIAVGIGVVDEHALVDRRVEHTVDGRLVVFLRGHRSPVGRQVDGHQVVGFEAVLAAVEVEPGRVDAAGAGPQRRGQEREHVLVVGVEAGSGKGIAGREQEVGVVQRHGVDTGAGQANVAAVEVRLPGSRGIRAERGGSEEQQILAGAVDVRRVEISGGGKHQPAVFRKLHAVDVLGGRVQTHVASVEVEFELPGGGRAELGGRELHQVGRLDRAGNSRHGGGRGERDQDLVLAYNRQRIDRQPSHAHVRPVEEPPKPVAVEDHDVLDLHVHRSKRGPGLQREVDGHGLRRRTGLDSNRRCGGIGIEATGDGSVGERVDANEAGFGSVLEGAVGL